MTFCQRPGNNERRYLRTAYTHSQTASRMTTILGVDVGKFKRVAGR
jgi:hypothetical protein